MKILITGARGFLGSTLIIVLKEAGYEPVAFEGDIRDPESAVRQISTIAPDAVVHTAAKIDVGWCEKNPEEAQSVNVEGTKVVLDAAAQASAFFINLSTTAVFSGRVGNYKETDPVEPLNVYAKTKVDAEAIVGAYPNSMTIRLTLIGARPDGAPGKNFLEWIKGAAERGEEITLFNDQFVNQLSNWTTANYIRRILELPVSSPQASSFPVLHLGTSDIHSKAAVGKMILERLPNGFGTKARVKEISVDSIGDNLFRPKQMWLNTDLASKLLGPMPSTKEELDTIFNKPPFRTHAAN